ncbi:MAG: acetamidase/formamidase family protein [Pseudomonadota bacterium]
MQHIRIDRGARLRDEPHTGHNRWHPDIEPIATVAPGETIRLETRDASDGQIQPGMTIADLDGLDTRVAHPVTGPVAVAGAVPGDLLEVEFVDIVAEPYGWTRIRPGAGFLREHISGPFLAHWHAADGFARSAQVPGVRIPEGAFMGTSAVAPSLEEVAAWNAREQAVRDAGGIAPGPDVTDAVPATGAPASSGLRTIPPRENGGNMDIKQLTRGSRLFLPVSVPGALFSTGDAHYAQGDSECCITAIEMGATVDVRFQLHAGRAARENIVFPRFAHPGYFLAPQWAAPCNIIATTGMPIRADGSNDGENVTLAAENALLAMIDLLVQRGYSREQAYVICSVAVDLRISNIVDLPNVTVSALLPEGIFE